MTQYPYYLNMMLHRTGDPVLREFRQTLTYTAPHFCDTLAPEDRDLARDETQRQQWQTQMITESQQHKQQQKRAAGQIAMEQAESQYIIDTIDDVNVGSDEREALIQQLRSTDETAYKRWLRVCDPGAYRDEYAAKKPAKKINRTAAMVKKDRTEALTRFNDLYTIIDSKEAI